MTKEALVESLNLISTLNKEETTYLVFTYPIDEVYNTPEVIQSYNDFANELVNEGFYACFIPDKLSLMSYSNKQEIITALEDIIKSIKNLPDKETKDSSNVTTEVSW